MADPRHSLVVKGDPGAVAAREILHSLFQASWPVRTGGSGMAECRSVATWNREGAAAARAMHRDPTGG